MSDKTLQSLTEWTQSRFSSLYERPGTDNEEEDGQAHADSTFQSQIKAMFSSDAQIYINHTGPVSVEEFSTQIGQTFGTNKSAAEWKEFFEIEDRDGQEGLGKSGIVAGYLIVTRTLKFRIRATPAKNYTHISLSAKIAHDQEVTQKGDDSVADNRRITQLFYTWVTKAAPVHLQGVRH